MCKLGCILTQRVRDAALYSLTVVPITTALLKTNADTAAHCSSKAASSASGWLASDVADRLLMPARKLAAGSTPGSQSWLPHQAQHFCTSDTPPRRGRDGAATFSADPRQNDRAGKSR